MTRKRLLDREIGQRHRRTLGQILDLAERWAEQLNAGSVNRAAIGRRDGLTRARVTQILDLLRLPRTLRCELRGAIETGARISEHELRSLLKLPPPEQRRRLRKVIAAALGSDRKRSTGSAAAVAMGET